MKIIKGLIFMFNSRGIKKGISRLLFIIKRFGFTPNKYVKCIEQFHALLKRHEIKATFFVPAIIFSKYYKHFNMLGNGSIEWGIHNDSHTDLSRFGKEHQKKHIDNAVEVFNNLNIPFKGFRAPYLKTNDVTLELIDNGNKFLYDSSVSMLWDEVYNETNNSYQWTLKFYNPQLHSKINSLPRIYRNIVQIPVSLPDDDILLDRDMLDANSVMAIWKKLLNICYEKKDIFVLQLHPERFCELNIVLDSLIKHAKHFDPPVWITTLNEVALWKKKNKTNKWPLSYKAVFCISGDIDSVTIFDFLDRLKKW